MCLYTLFLSPFRPLSLSLSICWYKSNASAAKIKFEFTIVELETRTCALCRRAFRCFIFGWNAHIPYTYSYTQQRANDFWNFTADDTAGNVDGEELTEKRRARNELLSQFERSHVVSERAHSLHQQITPAKLANWKIKLTPFMLCLAGWLDVLLI